MGLIIKLIVAIVVGIALGGFSPEVIVRLAITVKALLGELIVFIIPLIIFFFIASGISKLRHKGGKMLSVTLGLAYASSVVAGLLGLSFALFLAPELIVGGAIDLTDNVKFSPFFSIDMPPLASVMTVLVLAFLFGIGIATTDSDVLQQGVDQGRHIIELTIMRVVIPLLPFYVTGIFAEIAATGAALETLKVFGFVLVLAVIVHWLWLLILYFIAGSIAHQNPLRALKTMLPAYITALGTMSSAATIPVTLQQAQKNRVSFDVAHFSIPLCATIHLCGSIITIVTCAVAVMLLTDNLMTPSLATMFPFILMAAIILVAAPGVPGGAIIAILGLLESMLGFDSNALALMIALYLAQDAFGTACNVTGDGALALMVDRIR
ncbi:MAG: dicarboxylate/amino acid:cation symporter [Gammaproteobacteria bacterium]